MIRQYFWLTLLTSAVIVSLAIGIRAGIAQIGDSKPNTGPKILAQNPPPSNPAPISLTRAWDVVHGEAKKWRADVAMVQLASVDLGGSETEDAGKDGLRRSWQAQFASVTSDIELRIHVTDGAVVSVQEVKGNRLAPGQGVLVKPVIDSPNAANQVLIAKPNFGPGTVKPRGIHYILNARSDPGEPVITVTGSVKGAAAFVDVRAYTGELVQAKLQSYGSVGGIFYSNDLGLTWRPSNLVGKMVTDVSGSTGSPGVGYATVAQVEGIAVYRTENSGAAWAVVGQLPETAGTWPVDIIAERLNDDSDAIVVGTGAGLWLSKDGGRTWSQAPGLPSGSVTSLASQSGQGGLRIFVAIYSQDATPGLFSTTDLQNWRLEASGSFRLSESVDGSSVLAVDESKPGPQIVLGYGSSLNLPAGVLRAAGAFDGSSSIIAESSGEVYVSQDGGTSWRTTLIASLASLAVAPDFLSSGVALAGGFRGGAIHRSSDGGQTWSIALENASNICSGNGQIIDLAFLSSTNIVGVNGGVLTWLDF